jgi:outer membrane protein TolC
MKTLVTLWLVSFSGAAFAQTLPSSPPNPAPLTNRVQLTATYINRLVEEMRTANPTLQAARERTNAAGVNVATVRTWEDPKAILGGMLARQQLSMDDGDIMYGLEEKLPLFGKEKLARRVARAEFSTEVANAEYQFQVLRRELAKAAFQTALADEVVAVDQQDLTWLETTIRTMEGKNRSGEATLVEVLQLQNERAKRAAQTQTDADLLTHERVSLNRLLNRQLLSPWPVLELPAVAGAVHYNDALVDLALKHEPKVQMMQQQIKQAEATLDLTRRQRYPDISAGLEVRNYTGDGSFRQGVLAVSMSLPWANASKYRSEVQRDAAKLKAAELDLTDYELSVREEVHQLTVKIDAARREVLLYRDEIIPRSQSALESSRSGWAANRNSFRDVLDARRMLLDGRLMYSRALAEQYQMLSELVLCCGLGDLEALQMIGATPEAQPEGRPHAK